MSLKAKTRGAGHTGRLRGKHTHGMALNGEFVPQAERKLRGSISQRAVCTPVLIFLYQEICVQHPEQRRAVLCLGGEDEQPAVSSILQTSCCWRKKRFWWGRRHAEQQVQAVAKLLAAPPGPSEAKTWSRGSGSERRVQLRHGLPGDGTAQRGDAELQPAAGFWAPQGWSQKSPKSSSPLVGLLHPPTAGSAQVGEPTEAEIQRAELREEERRSPWKIQAVWERGHGL